MSDERSYSRLTDSDPSIRYQAVRDLRYEYEQEVGSALVEALIVEQSPRLMWLLLISVLPIWLPTLDHRLSKEQTWPFSGAVTLRVIELTGIYPIHSIQPHLEGWLRSSDFDFRYAAVRYLIRKGGDLAATYEAARELLNDLPNAFTVKTVEHSWMDEFYDLEKRTAELEEFLEQCDEPIESEIESDV